MLSVSIGNLRKFLILSANYTCVYTNSRVKCGLRWAKTPGLLGYERLAAGNCRLAGFQGTIFARKEHFLAKKV